MTTTRRPISFIATVDPETARTFYGNVLGLKLVESSPYALVFSDDGNMLRIQIVTDFSPASYTVHGWQVTHIEREIEELTSKGIVFLRYSQLKQDALDVWTSPDGHKIAWLNDPSGNILSLTEYARS